MPAFLFFLLSFPDAEASCSYGGTGLWNITASDNCAVANQAIILNGNLTVYGNLTLDNVTLQVNSSSDGQYLIQSMNASMLIINFSGISKYGTGNYLFRVEAGTTFVMNNSVLHNAGFADSARCRSADNFDTCGLYIKAKDAKILNNTITSNYIGVTLGVGANNTDVRYNNMSFNSVHGLYFYGSYNNTFINNTVNSNSGSGIWGKGTSNNTITGNVLLYNSRSVNIPPEQTIWNGDMFILSAYTLVQNNTGGQYVLDPGTDYSVFDSNYIYNILILGGSTDYTNVTNNIFYNSSYISGEGNRNTTVKNNIFYGGRIYAYSQPGYGYYTQDWVISNNSFINKATSFALTFSGSNNETRNTVDSLNNVNGMPIFYYYGMSSTVLDGVNASEVYLVGSSNVTIRNSTILGIYVQGTTNSTIANNTIYNISSPGADIYGILIISSSNNTIDGNNISSKYTGIYFTSSPGNIVSNNDVGRNFQGAIHLDSDGSSNNIFRGNRLHDNLGQGSSGAGIEMQLRNTGNIIERNIFYSNNVDIFLTSDLHNTIIRDNSFSNLELFDNIYLFYFSSNNNVSIENNTFFNSSIYFASICSNCSIKSNKFNASKAYLQLSGGQASNNSFYNPAGAPSLKLASSSNVVAYNNTFSNISDSYYYLSSSTNTTIFDGNNVSSIWLDTASPFSYSDLSSLNIWLKTAVSSAAALTRGRSPWSNISMKWSDSASSINATYNLTGLLAYTSYRVYTQTASSELYNNYNLTTDSNGTLSSFQLSLSGNTEIWVLNYSLPEVSFLSPTDDNGIFISRAWTYINVSINAQNGSIDTAMLVWNGASEPMACTGAFPSYVCGINKTGLADGTYAYYVLVNDSFGYSVHTESRALTIHTIPPSFLSQDRTYTPYSFIEPNFTVSDLYFSWLNFGWNNSNYSFYNDSLVLSMSFDSNPSIGETSSKIVDVSKYGNNGTLYGVLRASYSMIASGNSYLYEELSSIADYTIQSSDYLEYDIYWTSSTDSIAFDYTTSDGATLRDSGSSDQNGLYAHPAASLAAYAQNAWYHRKIALPVSHVGKTITYYDVASEYDTTATKTAYLDNIVITDGSGTVRKVIYRGESFTHSLHLINGGSLISLDNYANPVASVSGKFGNAIGFDGVDDYVSIPDVASLNITNNISIEVWVKPSQNTSHATILSKEDYGNKKGYLLHQLFGTGWMLRLYDGTSQFTITAVNNVSLNDWQHIVGTYNGTDMVLYKNGVMVISTTTVPASIANAPYPFLIGTRANVSGQLFNGTIDEVRIWNRSLSPEEIRMQYQSNFRKYNQTTWNFYSNISGLSEGNYTYGAFAGNTLGLSAQSNRILTVDMTPPSISLSLSRSSIYAEEPVTITCSASDDYQLSLTSLTVIKPGNSQVSTTCGQAFTDTSAAGSYTATYSATDASGNSASTSQTFAVNSYGSGSGSVVTQNKTNQTQKNTIISIPAPENTNATIAPPIEPELKQKANDKIGEVKAKARLEDTGTWKLLEEAQEAFNKGNYSKAYDLAINAEGLIGKGAEAQGADEIKGRSAIQYYFVAIVVLAAIGAYLYMGKIGKS